MKRKLGELLIESGAVSAADVDAVLDDQSAGEPSRLGDVLLSTGRCTPDQLAHALALQHGLSFTDLSDVAPEASGLIPLEFQRAHRLVPFRVERDHGAVRVHVAVADPTITDVVDELRAQLKREVVVHIAPIDDIENVHSALAGESAEAVVMGTALTEDGLGVTAEELFGSLDLEPTPPETKPLSTDLADEIGRHDAAPPQQGAAGFSALAAPIEELPLKAEPLSLQPEPEVLDAVIEPEPLLLEPERPLLEPLPGAEPLLDGELIAEPQLQVVPAPLVSPTPELPTGVGEETPKFGAPLNVPARIPSFAIPPEAPVEPPAAKARPAALGRIALKRIAVTRAGTPVDLPSAKPVIAEAPLPLPPPRPSEPELPDWMREGAAARPAASEAVPESVSIELAGLMLRLEMGDLPSGKVLAALFRLLVKRGVIEDSAAVAALEKL
jgi:hypothetical protein